MCFLLTACSETCARPALFLRGRFLFKSRRSWGVDKVISIVPDANIGFAGARCRGLLLQRLNEHVGLPVSCFSALSCAFNWVDWLTVRDKQGLEKRLCHASYNKFQLWLSIGSGVVVCSDKLLCIVYRTRKMNKRTDVPAVWLINEYTCLIGESDVL